MCRLKEEEEEAGRGRAIFSPLYTALLPPPTLSERTTYKTTLWYSSRLSLSPPPLSLGTREWKKEQFFLAHFLLFSLLLFSFCLSGGKTVNTPLLSFGSDDKESGRDRPTWKELTKKTETEGEKLHRRPTDT